MTSQEPVQPDPYFAGEGSPPPPPPAAPRPRRTAVVVLGIVAVLMFGGAATFATLWVVERGDHDKTTGQLSTRDKELADEKKAQDGTKTKLADTEKAKTDAEAKVTALTPCADAGKKLTELALNAATTEQQGSDAAQAIIFACK